MIMFILDDHVIILARGDLQGFADRAIALITITNRLSFDSRRSPDFVQIATLIMTRIERLLGEEWETILRW